MWNEKGSQQGKSMTRQNNMKAGYSSHGDWSTLGEVRIVEVEERGNDFPDISAYPDSTPVIWVCRTKRKALRYLALAEDWGLINDTSELLPKRLRNLLIEITKVLLHPSDIIACDDRDEGYLILRPTAQSSVNR